MPLFECSIIPYFFHDNEDHSTIHQGLHWIRIDSHYDVHDFQRKKENMGVDYVPFSWYCWVNCVKHPEP